MKNYTYRENRVFIPPTAEVGRIFMPRGEFGPVVQRVISETSPWEKGEDPIEEFTLPKEIGVRVVELSDRDRPMWGRNPNHKARNIEVSPYVYRADLNSPNLRTVHATLEMVGSPDKPILTRVYPGEYSPPLPWMQSAKNADGGRDGCIEFWKKHAYIITSMNRPTELSPEPPNWYA